MLSNLECIPCKSSQKVWCIINPKTNKLHRCTFSKSLAEWIVENYCPDYIVTRRKYRLGKVLEPGQKSNALYGIMSSSKHITLRCTLTPECAEILTECDSRYIQELYLVA